MHPNCIDLESAKKYDAEWQNDIQKARKSGKITLGMAIDAQGKRYEKLGKMKYERNSAKIWTQFALSSASSLFAVECSDWEIRNRDHLNLDLAARQCHPPHVADCRAA
jgi:hypothetical protein